MFLRDDFAILAVVVSIVIIVDRYRRRRGLPLPPGPKGWPILGNIALVGKGNNRLAFQRIAEETGSSLVHVPVFGNDIIIINDARTALDLLEKRGAIYADRFMPMVGDLVGLGNLDFGFMRYDQKWRDCRRVFHQYFHLDAVKAFRPIELESAHELLRRLLNDPAGMRSHVRNMATSAVLAVAYGIDPNSPDLEYVELAQKANMALAETLLPGPFLVDFLPALKYVPSWFPGAGFRRQAHEWRGLNEQMFSVGFQKVKARLPLGGPVSDSVAGNLLSELNEKDQSDQDRAYKEDIIRLVTGVMYSAGSDTIQAVLAIFFLCMIVYPEVQERAHRELDAVLEGRLPTFDDQPSLPYISAIVKETVRWIPVVPLIFPRVLMEDDIYEGYFLPKGSQIMTNAWAISRNKATYGDDAAEYNPSRFLNASGKLDSSVPEPHAVFGYGRRICPGRHMALEAIWLAVASVLAVFRIEKPLDADGQPSTVEAKFTTGALLYAEEFGCMIKPRSQDAEKLIRGTLD